MLEEVDRDLSKPQAIAYRPLLSHLERQIKKHLGRLRVWIAKWHPGHLAIARRAGQGEINQAVHF